jgi:hypothetical protein
LVTYCSAGARLYAFTRRTFLKRSLAGGGAALGGAMWSTWPISDLLDLFEFDD